MTETLVQVLCNEAGVPVHEMMDNDVAARELTLDTKMRAFFRLSAFSHRCAASASNRATPLHPTSVRLWAAASIQWHCTVRVCPISLPSCVFVAEALCLSLLPLGSGLPLKMDSEKALLRFEPACVAAGGRMRPHPKPCRLYRALCRARQQGSAAALSGSRAMAGHGLAGLA